MTPCISTRFFDLNDDIFREIADCRDARRSISMILAPTYESPRPIESPFVPFCEAALQTVPLPTLNQLGKERRDLSDQVCSILAPRRHPGSPVAGVPARHHFVHPRLTRTCAGSLLSMVTRLRKSDSDLARHRMSRSAEQAPSSLTWRAAVCIVCKGGVGRYVSNQRGERCGAQLGCRR